MASLKHGGKIVATIGPGQRALDLAIDTGRKPLDLTPLANTKLTSIIIRFTEDGDLPTVKLPPSMPALRTLVVSGKISNWKVLGAYTGLEKLDAGAFTEVTSIDWLAGLTKLRDLEIDVGAAKSVDVIADLPLLERLDLRGYALNAAALGRATRLEELDLYLSKTVKGLDALAALTNLEKLSIEESGLRDLGICEGMTKLRDLRVVGGLAAATGIAKLTRLEELHLDRTQITDLRPLEKLAHLRVLSLRFSRKLADLAPLAKLTKLRELDLYECRPLKSLRPIAKLTQLEALDFDLTTIADGDTRPLHNLRKLKSLAGAVETPQQLAALSKALPKCRPMYVEVTDEGDTIEVGSVVVHEPENPGDGWLIFQDLVDDLGVDDQDDVETMVAAAMKKAEPKLAKKIVYDSEGSAFVASSRDEDAIMALAKVIDALIEGEDYDPDNDD